MKKRIQRAANATIKKARCLAGFSGSVAQLRFACLPQAARVSESRPRIVRFVHRARRQVSKAKLSRPRIVRFAHRVVLRLFRTFPSPFALSDRLDRSDKKLEFVRICTDLYGFVRKVIIKSRVCFLRTHPYPSVPIRIPRKNTGIKRANATLKSSILKRRQMSVAKLSRPIQKRCYAPFIRSIRKGSGRVGLAY